MQRGETSCLYTCWVAHAHEMLSAGRLCAPTFCKDEYGVWSSSVGLPLTSRGCSTLMLMTITGAYRWTSYCSLNQTTWRDGCEEWAGGKRRPPSCSVVADLTARLDLVRLSGSADVPCGSSVHYRDAQEYHAQGNSCCMDPSDPVGNGGCHPAVQHHTCDPSVAWAWESLLSAACLSCEVLDWIENLRKSAALHGGHAMHACKLVSSSALKDCPAWCCLLPSGLYMST